ncbi:MAG: HAMP domain-containing protein [Synechococcaceae cyanobacterium RL_1_2]|nr:HAMP domain-containing protein [Synechococcaceae cyanobacterium RL_1_2]
MNIKTKFIASSIMFSTLITGLILGVNTIIQSSDERFQLQKNQAFEALETTIGMQLALNQEVNHLKDFILLERAGEDMGKFQQAKSDFIIGLSSLQGQLPHYQSLETIRRQHRSLINLADRLENNEEASFTAIRSDMEAVNSFSQDIQFYIDDVRSYLYAQEKIASQNVESFNRFVVTLECVVVGLSLLIFVVQFKWILLPVVESLKELQQGTLAIGTGKLDYRLALKGNQEFQSVGEAFNQMAMQLEGFYVELEQKVKDRTQDLETINADLHQEMNKRLRVEQSLRDKNETIKQTLEELQRTQAQMVHSEKMSSLGQMVAGVAHEINNPVNFIYGNIVHAEDYLQDLLGLVQLYQQEYPDPAPRITDEMEAIELDFVMTDVVKVMGSMKMGAKRIQEIVKSLRTFSRLDEADAKTVDLHEGIDSTLLILQNRLKAKNDRPTIEVLKHYGDLPPIDCYPGQLNQVFMNILVNAIDVLEEQEDHGTSGIITITTTSDGDWATITIADNGPGIPEETRSKLFDPFFTTKTIGKGTGLGLSIVHSIIVDKHRGAITCNSEIGQGATFAIKIPLTMTELT